MKNKSWKTSVGSVIAAAGIALQASDDDTLRFIGLVLSSLGTLMLGVNAKDRDVTGGTRQQ